MEQPENRVGILRVTQRELEIALGIPTGNRIDLSRTGVRDRFEADALEVWVRGPDLPIAFEGQEICIVRKIVRFK